jgi:hypothetical protein
VSGKTLQEMREKHYAQVEANRRRPVATSPLGGPKADLVLEVVEGKHHMPARPTDKAKGIEFERGVTIVPGERFVPTLAQAESLTRKGGLDAGDNRKFRVVEGAAASTLTRASRKPQSTGADIGLRSLKTLKGEALKAALDAGLQVEDFAEVEPSGQFGRYTFEQVNDVIRAKGGD